jgi:hypothetical protein
LNHQSDLIQADGMIHHSFDVTKLGPTWQFSAGDSIEEIIKDPAHAELLETLAEPAGLTGVLLRKSNRLFSIMLYRRIDVTGLTVFEVLQRLVKFYSNKTFRRLLGDNHFFEGFEENDDGFTRSVMGS